MTFLGFILGCLVLSYLNYLSTRHLSLTYKKAGHPAFEKFRMILIFTARFVNADVSSSGTFSS